MPKWRELIATYKDKATVLWITDIDQMGGLCLP